MKDSVHSEATSKKNKSTRFVPLLIIILINIVVLSGIVWWTKKQTDNLIINNSLEQEHLQKEFFTVNHTPSFMTDNEAFEYETFQLKFPSEYLVTSNDMILSYASQGGPMMPLLYFTLNTQLLGENPPSNYIFLFSTTGFTEIEDWTDFYHSFDYEIISEENIEKESFTINKRVISYAGDSNNTLEAYIFLPEEVSYFFGTEGNVSEEDFESIVGSLKLRAFVDWE